MTSSPASSYSLDSDTDSGSEQSHICMDHRYLGTVDSPCGGVVNEELGPVTVTLELLDENGTPLGINQAHTVGIVVNLVLATPDGTMDAVHTPSGEQLLLGNTAVSPSVVGNKMVAKFERLSVQRAGTYRFHVRVFNIYDTVQYFTAQGDGEMRIPSDSLYNGTSELLVIGERCQ